MKERASSRSATGRCCIRGVPSSRYVPEAVATIADNPEKAKTLLREALGYDLYHGAAHNNLGVLLLGEGKLDIQQLLKKEAKLDSLRPTVVCSTPRARAAPERLLLFAAFEK